MKLINDEYILEIDDLLENSEIGETDLVDIFGEKYKFHLTRLSKKTYQAMYSAYRGIRRLRQQKALRYMIKQSEDYQRVIMEAEIEYVRGAIISGIDLRDYDNDKTHKVFYPKSVIDILRSGGLFILGEIQYNESEIE